MVKVTTSSTFSRETFLNDGNAAWKHMIDRCEGSTQREQEAKIARALLRLLDIRTSGYDFQNYFQEHAQQLKDLQSIKSESMHVDWFIDHIENLDYDCAVEDLKASFASTLQSS